MIQGLLAHGRRAVLAACCAACLAWAASPAAWEMNSYQDFVKGRFHGVSLSRDGRLVLAPRLDALFSSDQSVIWSVAKAPDGTAYFGTGHLGRLYRLSAAGVGEVIWTADQPEIFAVAADNGGRVFAASSPNGKIYRIENGRATEYFAPGVRYIWSLAFGKDGALYAGTGDQGKVFRIEGPGRGEVFYETGQLHVTSLAADVQGRLLVGTEPNGILYRVSAKDKAFVLYDANLPEVRAIVPAPDGSTYVAAMGGAISRQTAAAASGPAQPATISVTATSASVTVEGAQSGVEIKPKPEGAVTPQPATAAASAAPAVPSIEQTGVEKSALYRIHPDNTVETLWSSKEENVYDLQLSGGNLLFSTDEQGRIYQLGPKHELAMLIETRQSEAVRLAPSGRGWLVATGNMGKIYRLQESPAESGDYEAPVHDAATVARWGRLRWQADSCQGCRVAFRTRSGNSVRPDRTWSEWSQPLTDPAGSQVESPGARYVQWKAEFTGASAKSPILDSVRLGYQPQNTPPVVRSITVVSQAVAASQTRPLVVSSAAVATYTLTVTETGEAGPTPSTGTPTQNVPRPAEEQLVITWVGEDPDGDRLAYTLTFRGEGEREWKPLRANPAETSFTLESNALADGRYFFKVEASDLQANPPSRAQTAELISSPVLIDHTPPQVTFGQASSSSGSLEWEVTAEDQASPLIRCEYSLDAGPWKAVEAADGVADSLREKFVVRLDPAPKGEHLLVVRVFDSAGNAGLARQVLR